MKNTFGNALGLTIFGESHGAAAAAPAEMGFPPPAPSRMWWSF